MENNYTFKINSLEDITGMKVLVERNNMEKPNFSKIGRELGVSRETVRKYYNGFKKKNTKCKKSKVDAHHKRIFDLLNDEFKQFDYVSSLYRYLKREFDDIDYSEATLRRYIHKNFESEFNSSCSRKSIRFETEAGIQAQFDYKENQSYIDSYGNKLRTDIASLLFGLSRHNFRQVIPDKTTETTISYMAETFETIGGVPDKLVIDNGSSMVQKAKTKYRDAILVPMFEQFLKDYGISWFVCKPNSPQTKGKVEVQMKMVNDLKAYNGEYSDYIDINDKLQLITAEENTRISQATGLPPSFLFEKEKERLKPLPCKEIRSKYFIKMKEVIVNRQSLISFKSNLYSVPPKYIGKKIGRRLINNKLHLYYNTEYVCTHVLSTKKVNYLESHQKELSKLIYGTEDINADISANLASLNDNVKKLEELNYE